jgi:BlaI family penicillinase repressor
VTVRNADKRPLTELQRAILDIVWAASPINAEQIRGGLLPKHPLKDSSVRTLLRRLETQGYLTHRTEGKTYLYEAVAGSQTVAASAVRQLIDRFWSGSVDQFLAGMVDEKVLSVEQIERLAKKVRSKK